MMMRQEELEALQKIFPFAPLATSYGMGWKGLQAVRYLKSHISELSAAGPTRTPGLVLTIQPSEKKGLRYEGVERDRALPAGSVQLVPAGSCVLWRPPGRHDSLPLS